MPSAEEARHAHEAKVLSHMPLFLSIPWGVRRILGFLMHPHAPHATGASPSGNASRRKGGSPPYTPDGSLSSVPGACASRASAMDSEP